MKKIKGFEWKKYFNLFALITGCILAVVNAYLIGLIQNLPERQKVEIVSGLDIDFSEKVEEVGDSGEYVASKNGSKYYLTTCSGANRIKEGNRVYFSSKSDAEKAGYGPSKTCKGL